MNNKYTMFSNLTFYLMINLISFSPIFASLSSSEYIENQEERRSFNSLVYEVEEEDVEEEDTPPIGARPRPDPFPPEYALSPFISDTPEKLLKPFSVHLVTSSQDEGEIKKISLFPLRILEKKYKIPREELIKISRSWIHRYKERVEKASNIDNEYTIMPHAIAFSATEQAQPDEIYDYYDIFLNLKLHFPNALKCNYFLPHSFIVRSEPVRYNQESRKWEVIKHDDINTLIWQHSPHAIIGNTVISETKGYTCSASFTAGAVGPSPSVSLTATASYSSSLSFNRTIAHMDIAPDVCNNEAHWVIRFNDLHADEGKGCFSPNGTITPDSLRWVWKINREEAKKKLYTDYSLGGEHRSTFYFNIKLFARFAQIAPAKFKVSKSYLPIFDINDGASQIYGIEVPPLNKDLTITETSAP